MNWYSLGGSLGLDNDTRNAINIKHPGDAQSCLEEMIAKRLQSGGSLSWKDLCNSLRNPTVNRNDVATEIEHQIGEFKYNYSLKATNLELCITMYNIILGHSN